MNRLKLNHVAIWLVAVLHQFVAAVWYSPLLFSDRWIQATGLKETDFSNPSPVPYVISFIGAVVMCYGIAWLFFKLQVQTAGKGLQYTLLFWVSFLFFEIVTFNSFELRTYTLSFIDAGKSFVTFALTGVILGAWIKTKTPVYKAPVYANA